MILSVDDICRITEYTQPQKQCAALVKLGIKFGVTLNGSPIVAESELERWATGKKTSTATIRMDKLDA